MAEKEAAPNASEERSILGFIKDQDWIQEIDFYRTRVRFGQADTAELTVVGLEVPKKLLTHVLVLAKAFDPSAGPDAMMATFESLFQDGDDTLWAVLDELCTKAVSRWDLSEYERVYSRPAPPVPSEISDAGERLRMLLSLPWTIPFAVGYAILWQLKNSLRRSGLA